MILQLIVTGLLTVWVLACLFDYFFARHGHSFSLADYLLSREAFVKWHEAQVQQAAKEYEAELARQAQRFIMPTFIYKSEQWQDPNDSRRVIRAFPIQTPRWQPASIPWPVAEEAYTEYAAQYGKQQTLERLAERGGFGMSEMAILLYERILRLEAESKQAKEKPC